jgi:hypothetical protein
MSFEQGGQIDWVGLTSTIVSVPVSILARLSQAGVDGYTLEMGKVFGRQFNIAESYRRAVEKQLARSEKFGISSNTFFFGTGISVIPRLLGATRGGVSFAGIVMALRATYDPHYTARVLSEMIKSVCPPDICIPSITQFESLSDELAATMVADEIANLVWGMELAVHAQFPDITLQSLKMVPSAHEMAATILSLTTLSPGQKVFIRATITGTAWIAAFADRVVGLRVSYQVRSKIVWESSVLHREGSEMHGSVIIQYTDRNREAPAPDIPSTELEILRDSYVSLNVFNVDPETQSQLGVPLSQGVRYLMDFRGLKSKNACDMALKSVARAVWNLKGSVLTWSGSPNIEHHSQTFEPKAQDLLHLCRLMYPESTIEMSDLTKPYGSPQQRQLDFNISGSSLCMFILSGFTDTASHATIADIHKEQDIGLLLIMLLLLYVRSTTEIRLDARRLHELTFHHTSINPPPMFGIRKAATRTQSKSTGDSIKHPVYIAYHTLLDEIFKLLHGPSHNPNVMNPTLAKFAWVAPVAVGTVGKYTVLASALDPCQDVGTAMTVLHGHGGIFMSGKTVNRLESLENATDMRKSFNARCRALRADIRITTPPGFLERYGRRAESSSVDLAQKMDGFPLKGGLDFEMTLFAAGKDLFTKIAWSITARDGIDMVVDAFISPHAIIFHQIERKSWQPGQFDSLPAPRVALRNIESYLLLPEKHNGYEKTVVMAQSSKAIELLAMCHERPGVIIRHTPDMNMEDSLKRLLASATGGSIIVVGYHCEATQDV